MKKTLVLMIVLAGLLVTFVLARRMQVDPPEAQGLSLAKGKLGGAKSVQVSGAHRWSLRRTPEAWQVQAAGNSEVYHLAEPSLVKALFVELEGFRADEVVSDDVSRHKEFEVDEGGGLRLQVFGNEGVLGEFVFGRQRKPGESYVRSPESNRVFVTSSPLPLQLRRPAGAWRRQRLFNFEADDFERLSVQHADGETWSLVRKEAAWELSQAVDVPKGFRLSASYGARASQQLASLLAFDYIEGGASLEALGLSPPVARINATLKNGQTLEVGFGSSWSDVDAARVEKLSRSFGAFDANRDGYIEQKEVGVLKDSGNEALRSLAVGLADPQLFARIDTGGRAGEKGDGRVSGPDFDSAWRFSSAVPARLNGKGEAFWVTRPMAKMLTARLDDLRDLSLLKVVVETLARWELESPKAKVILERRNDTWTLVDAQPSTVVSNFRPEKSESELRSLVPLIAQRRAREGEVNEAAFTPPTLVLTFIDREGKTQKLIFGRDVRGEGVVKEVYVKGSVDSDVYVVPVSLRERLEQVFQ